MKMRKKRTIPETGVPLKRLNVIHMFARKLFHSLVRRSQMPRKYFKELVLLKMCSRCAAEQKRTSTSRAARTASNKCTDGDEE